MRQVPQGVGGSMRNMNRAELKKARKQVRVGDHVTWGRGVSAHEVLEIRHHGVVVDAADVGFPRLFVAFDGNARWGVHHQDGGRAKGTLRVVRRSNHGSV